MSKLHKSARLTLLLLALLAVSGCSSMIAQNPGEGLSPVNAVAQGEDDHLMLFGADVVAYFTENRFVQGSEQYRSEYQDVDFHFSSAANKALFDANPAGYIPQYGGYCANGIAFGIPWGGSADSFLLHDGKLYIFGGNLSKQAVLLDLEKYLALADRYWREEVSGNNSFWQRARRLILRVPHYQSGEEQAEAVRSARDNPG